MTDHERAVREALHDIFYAARCEVFDALAEAVVRYGVAYANGVVESLTLRVVMAQDSAEQTDAIFAQAKVAALAALKEAP